MITYVNLSDDSELMRKEIQYSVHHLLPKSRGGSNDDTNTMLLRNSVHSSIHSLFANQMIGEQLITTVGLSSKALRSDVVAWLMDTLMCKDIRDPSQRYKEEAIKKPKIFIPK